MSDLRVHGSSGGAANSGGTTFQEDVACYLSTLILAESGAEPPAGLPQDVTPSTIFAETSEPIDDLFVGTSVDGGLYFQVKTALSLSKAANSEFAGVLRQFVAQYLVGARPNGGVRRRLDPTRDRLVLAVGPGAPRTITEGLSGVLKKCRSVTDDKELSALVKVLNVAETKTLATVRAHIQNSWKTAKGATPMVRDELSIIHLMRVLQFDLQADGAHLDRAKDLLRQVVLTDPDRSGDAWDALVSICRSFGPERTGGDLPYLREELQHRGIPVRSVPSFAPDIESLQKYTVARQAYLRRLSEMQVGEQTIKITRPVIIELHDYAMAGHTAVIGEPGTGKSGCLHDLATRLLDQGANVVLLAADMLDAPSPEALAADLGLSRSRGLVDVLQNWSGDGHGFLLIDALDAARSGTSLHVLCEMLHDVRERATRWRIVASIREYDLRTSPDVQKLFAGTPHAAFADQRFPAVRHMGIARLSTDELSEVKTRHPKIAAALQSTAALGDLVRNLFNLNLLCELLDGDVSAEELCAVETQTQLLRLYWKHRVEAKDRTASLLVLNNAVRLMVEGRRLHVSRQSVAAAAPAQADALDKLCSDGVLVELVPTPTAAPLIGFSHNILFDFAVCRCWLDGLSDDVVASLSYATNADLLLAIRPSLVMAFEELWLVGPSREDFWKRAIAFEQAPGMRLIGKIIAAGVAAAQFGEVTDAAFLVEALKQRMAPAATLLLYRPQFHGIGQS